MFRKLVVRPASVLTLLCASAYAQSPAADVATPTTAAPSQTPSPHTPPPRAAPPAPAPPPPPEPAPPTESPAEQRMTLAQVLAHALRHAPAALVSRAAVSAGRAEVEANSPLLPSDPVVSASVGRRWTGAGAGVDYSIALEQELDLAGRRGLQLEAARSTVRAREAERGATEWSVHQQVHAAYHQALVARERLIAAERMQAFAERLALVAEQRFRAGETSPLPARLAAGEVAQARQARLLASSDYTSSRLELARIAGWTGRALLTPAEELESPEQPPDIATLLRTAHERQPALRAARARHQAAQAQLSAAERRAWPNPTLGVSFENEAEPGASPARIVSGTLSIPLPLWVGNKPEASRARGALEQASAERAALIATLEPGIVQARARVAVNAERALLFGAEILPTFEKNLELLQKAFELGEIDILQVLVAQERFLDAQQDALQAFADYYDSWAELEAAVGAELHETAHAKPPRAGDGAR